MINLLSKRARNIGGAAHLIKLYFEYLTTAGFASFQQPGQPVRAL
jgi:hypothetical protein